MSDNIQRQKITGRDDFTYEEKVAIASKSDNKCCHCGKEVYFGYGATIDHFVPLSEGGLNRDLNLIMLCYDCNQEKKSKILEPELYLKYLKKEHKDKLMDYFDSYIRSFDFFNKRNVMACDEYEFQFYPPSIAESHRSKNGKSRGKYDKKIKENTLHLLKVKLKRGFIDDINKITEYYAKYLKKVNCLESKEKARENVALMLKYGCIYYVEKSDGITAMCFVSIERDSGRVGYGKADYTISLLIMPYYSNDVSYNMARLLCEQIPFTIYEEQGLKCIFVSIKTFKNERFFYSGLYPGNPKFMYDMSPFIVHPVVFDKRDSNDEDIEKTNEFLNKHHPDYDEIQKEMKEMYGEDCFDDGPLAFYGLFDLDKGRDDIGLAMAKKEFRKQYKD